MTLARGKILPTRPVPCRLSADLKTFSLEMQQSEAARISFIVMHVLGYVVQYVRFSLNLLPIIRVITPLADQDSKLFKKTCHWCTKISDCFEVIVNVVLRSETVFEIFKILDQHLRVKLCTPFQTCPKYQRGTGELWAMSSSKQFL